MINMNEPTINLLWCVAAANALKGKPNIPHILNRLKNKKYIK